MSASQLKLSVRLLGLSRVEEVLLVLSRWRVERMLVVDLPVLGCDLNEWGKEARKLKLSEEVVREEGLSLGVELSVGWEEYLRGRRGRPRSASLEVLSESDGVDVFSELLAESGDIGVSLSKKELSCASKAAKADKAAAKEEAKAAKAAAKKASQAEKEAAKAAKEAAKAAKEAAKEEAKAAKEAAKEEAAAKKVEKEAAKAAKEAAKAAKEAAKEEAAAKKVEKDAAKAAKEAAKACKETKKNKESKPAPELLASIGVGPLKDLADDGELNEEAYEDEEVSVRVFEHGGVKWLKDDEGSIYDPESHEEVGTWNEAEQRVVLIGGA